MLEFKQDNSSSEIEMSKYLHSEGGENALVVNHLGAKPSLE